MAAGLTSQERDNLAYTLLKLIEELVSELHADKPRSFVLGLDSSIDDDIGLDSLARVELIARIEHHFNVTLPQRVFAEAESPRDLLRSISSARGQTQALSSEIKVELAVGKGLHFPAYLSLEQD